MDHQTMADFTAGKNCGASTAACKNSACLAKAQAETKVVNDTNLGQVGQIGQIGNTTKVGSETKAGQV